MNCFKKKLLLCIISAMLAFSLSGCACVPLAAGLTYGLLSSREGGEVVWPEYDFSDDSGTTADEELSQGASVATDGSSAQDVAYTDWQAGSALYNGTITYDAPDLDELETALDTLLDDIYSGSFTVDELLEKCAVVKAMYETVDTQYSIVYVLYAHDVTNEYYNTEQQRLETGLNALDVKLTDASIAIMELDEAYVRSVWGDDYCDTVINGDKLNDESIQDLVKKEAELVSKYDTFDSTFVLEASDGKTYDLDAINDVYYEQGYDAYSKLWNEYFTKHNEGAGSIYLELVSVRDEMAKMLGFDDFAEYRYACYGRDYSVDDVKALQSYVKEYLVPLYITAALLNAYSDGVKLSEVTYPLDSCIAKFKAAALDFSPELYETIEYMESEGLYDFGNNENRMDASFTTFFHDYEKPFLFITWKDTYRNASTLIHETGHFYNFHVNPMSGWSVSSPLDLAEIDSQGLEMLMMKYYDSLYGSNAQKASLEKLQDGLYPVITGCMEDEFQTAVYEHPEWTLAQMNSFYKKLSDEYGFTVLYGYTGVEWTSISHTFQSPMYYISYAVSMIPALELWDLSQKDYDKAKDTYLSIVHREAYPKLRTVMKENGLADPLAEDTVISISDAMMTYFRDNFPETDYYYAYALQLLGR